MATFIKMTADLHGLILMGGKSSRMGEDKSLIDYHGKPQLEYLLEVMTSTIKEVFVSTREGQQIVLTNNLILDQYNVKGPLNGLLSAHKSYPHKAWLVFAIDMPLVTKQTIDRLIANRDEHKVATAYASKGTGLPEPLAAIWEPAGLKELMTLYEKDQVVYPRKFLLESEVELVLPENEDELLNVNDPSDLAKVHAILNKNSSE